MNMEETDWKTNGKRCLMGDQVQSAKSARHQSVELFEVYF